LPPVIAREQRRGNLISVPSSPVPWPPRITENFSSFGDSGPAGDDHSAALAFTPCCGSPALIDDVPPQCPGPRAFDANQPPTERIEDMPLLHPPRGPVARRHHWRCLTPRAYAETNRLRATDPTLRTCQVGDPVRSVRGPSRTQPALAPIMLIARNVSGQRRKTSTKLAFKLSAFFRSRARSPRKSDLFESCGCHDAAKDGCGEGLTGENLTARALAKSQQPSLSNRAAPANPSPAMLSRQEDADDLRETRTRMAWHSGAVDVQRQKRRWYCIATAEPGLVHVEPWYPQRDLLSSD